MMRCRKCGLRGVMATETKSVPGKHYHCEKCGYEWQSRVVNRYRQRKIFTEALFKIIWAQRSKLNLQDRFFIEKMYEQGKNSLRYLIRLQRIAHKLGIDIREIQ